MNLNIKGTNIELNDSLKKYATQKVKDLTKFFDNILKVEVDIGMRSHHHQKGKIFYAEVNLHVPNRVIRVVKEAEDLYKAIDKVKDHLKQELDEAKEKMRQVDREEIRDSKEYHIEEN